MATEIAKAEEYGARCNDNMQPLMNTTGQDNSCAGLKDEDFMSVIITSMSELPGIFFTMFIIEKMGRKQVIMLEYGIATISLIILAFCNPKGIETVLQFILRGAVTGGFQVLYLYTPEVYPTNLRSTGNGFCVAMSRLGGMFAPFLIQMLWGTNLGFTLPISILTLISLCSITATFFLPYETKGKNLNEDPTKTA